MTVRDDAPPDGAGRRLRWELWALTEVSALCGLAIVQPMLDVTGRAPDFFLFHGASRTDIIVLIAAVTILPPLLLWGPAMACGLAVKRLRRPAHVLTVASLCGMLAIQVGKWLLPVQGLPLVLLAAAGGLIAAVVYVRWRSIATVLRLVAVGPLVFIVLFSFASPSSALMLDGDARSTGAGRPIGPHPPLVVVLLDEFPQLSLLDETGGLDAQRFPHFARLARESTWYRNATAVRGYTPYAVPSMLTGRFPTRPVVPHYSHYPDNLFTLLAGAYDLKVREGITYLCPPWACSGERTRGAALPVLLEKSSALLGDLLSPRDSPEEPAAGFVEPSDRTPSRRPTPDKAALLHWSRMDESQPTRFRDFVAGLRPSDRPTLHFLHLLLPHRPFRYLPSGMLYNPRARLPKDGVWLAQLTRQRHLLQTQYVDRLLGIAMRAMRESGLYDKAVVVVTADHGVSFTARAALERGVGPDQRTAAEIAWVPLFIKASGQRTGNVDHRNWLHVDLLPTLADYAGMGVPWPVHGLSALRQRLTTQTKPYTWATEKELSLNPGHGARVLAGPDDAAALPAPPRHDLVGQRTARVPIVATNISATVDKAAALSDVGATLPALISGDLPESVPAGAQLAIALNGTIGTVVPVLPSGADEPEGSPASSPTRSLFRPGVNRVEVFLVSDDGSALERLRLR